MESLKNYSVKKNTEDGGKQKGQENKYEMIDLNLTILIIILNIIDPDIPIKNSQIVENEKTQFNTAYNNSILKIYYANTLQKEAGTATLI